MGQSAIFEVRAGVLDRRMGLKLGLQHYLRYTVHLVVAVVLLLAHLLVLAGQPAVGAVQVEGEGRPGAEEVEWGDLLLAVCITRQWPRTQRL